MKTFPYLFLALAFAASAATAGPSLEGDWSRGDGKAKVRIAPCGDDLCAVNTWMRPDVRDEKVGDRLVMTLRQVDDTTWKGKAFDPQRNLTYAFTLNVGAADMTTTGCLLGGLLCKSMGWTRIR